MRDRLLATTTRGLIVLQAQAQAGERLVYAPE